jgi:Na+/proline symporter
VAIIVPFIFFAAGFPAAFETGAGNLTPAQGNFFSSEAFLGQGAPYIAAVLAYAIGNQTIAQRLFAVREDLIKPTFITATVGYGAMVIGVGMLGVLALYLGFEPSGGDVNNIIPEMAASYLPGILLALFFIMIIGALSSTADSDLAALSSIMMADVYGQNIAGKEKANPTTMLFIGRATMVAASAIAVAFASLQLNILDLLVFVGALWGALVFPVLASLYWGKVTNKAFTVSVLAALAVFIPVRFELIPLVGPVGLLVDVLSAVGIAVVLGLMTFGFFGLKVARIVAAAAFLLSAPFVIGFLHDYATLSASLVAYAVSTLVCIAMSFRQTDDFDFSLIRKRTGDFDESEDDPQQPAAADDSLHLSRASRDGADATDDRKDS